MVICHKTNVRLYYTAGFLITGGQLEPGGWAHTAELYVPSSGESCTLPSLPDNRYDHTVSEGGLLCGGGDIPPYSQTRDSCLQWSPDTGTWEEALTLNVSRYDHVSWTPSSGIGTYLMGGEDSPWTTTLITPEGSQEPGFPLKHDTR